MKTLLLNASYEPLAVIPLQRAVVLVLDDKAELVEADGEIRSPSTTLPRPSVIRLTRYVKVPFRGTLPLTKKGVLARDNHRCVYCDARASTVDHVVPQARGGRDEWTNLVAACAPCNQDKGDSLLSELGWSLPYEPYAPKGRRWVVVAYVKVQPSWEPYLAAWS